MLIAYFEFGNVFNCISQCLHFQSKILEFCRNWLCFLLKSVTGTTAIDINFMVNYQEIVI